MATTSAGVAEAPTGENLISQLTGEHDLYQKKVEKFLKPLEARWDYIRSVLLWKKPVHSLCVFIAVNGIFSYFSSGHFRVFLVISTVMAFALCLGEVRSRAGNILERAGITPEERESYEASLTFNRLCYKIAIIWEFFALQYLHIKELKTTSYKKYYGVITMLFLAAVFTYQYCPLLKILYCTLLFLYLWPPVKYHGTHYVIYGAIEPFCRPFIVHWKHSRTKRERNQILKVNKGEDHAEDSDEEFTKAFHPKVDSKQPPGTSTKDQNEQASTSVDRQDGQHISKDKQVQNIPLSTALDEPQVLPSVMQEPLVPEVSQEQEADPPTPSQEPIQDPPSPSQDSLDLELPDDSSSVNFETNSQASLGPDTPGGSSVSFESSASFLPDSQQFPSLSQGTGSWDADEDDLIQGLQFPDIESKEYHSSNESLNAYDGSSRKSSINRTDATDTARQQGLNNSTQLIQRAANRQSGLPSTSARQSNASSDVSADFEFLDRCEVDEMETNRDGDRASSPGAVGAVTSYVGKWFGY